MTQVSDRYLRSGNEELVVETVDSLSVKLRNLIIEYGEDRLARRLGVTPRYLREVAGGHRPPHGQILKFLGYRAVIVYAPTEP